MHATDTQDSSAVLTARYGTRLWQRLPIRAFEIITTSRVNYRVAPVFDAACPVVLAWLGLREGSGWLLALSAFCTGWFVFSFIEYVIHRWVFHVQACFMNPIHMDHHHFPRKPTALPFFTSPGAALILWSLFVIPLGHEMACLFLCGLMSGYVYYSLIHHVEHHARISALPFRWLRKMGAAHLVHHRHADANFGVSTAFWDRVFGTDYRSRKRG